MRLGDLDELKNEFEWLESVVCECQKDSVRDSIQRVENAPTIDPETLPIVQELRKELEWVTRERDAAILDLYAARSCKTCALLFTDDCLLEECFEPCSAFIEGPVPYKWQGVQEVPGDD